MKITFYLYPSALIVVPLARHRDSVPVNRGQDPDRPLSMTAVGNLNKHVYSLWHIGHLGHIGVWHTTPSSPIT